MIWLAPGAAILGAALALPALAAIYMLRLRRRPVRVSAASLWNEAAEDLEANVPLRWLRASWLLLAQLLALLMLVAALGRPAIPSDRPSAVRAVVLIDVSASMRARLGDGRTRFELARERARALIDDLDEGTERRSLALVAFGARPVALTPMTSDRRALRRALETLEPTDEPGDLSAALELASALVRGGDEGDREAAAIWIIGDGGYESTEPLSAPGEVAFVGVGAGNADNADDADDADAPGNIGVVALAARRDYRDPVLVRVLVSVAHADDRERAAVLRLTLDGEEIERRALSIERADAGGLSERAHSFDVRSVDGGLLRVELSPGGTLDADDRASLTLRPASRPRLVWVTPDTDDDRVERWVLGDVIEALDAGDVRRVPAGSASDISADLWILDGVDADARGLASAAPALQFLAPTSDAPVSPVRVVSWDRDHPTLRHAPLDQLVVRRRAELPPPTSDATRSVLARGPDGPLIVEDSTTRGRRVLVAFDPTETDWPLQPGFAVFVASCVDYLTLRAERDTGRRWRTGEVVSIPTGRPPGQAGDVVVLDAEGVPVETTVIGGEARFRPARAGVHRLEGVAGARWASVNVESRTETAARMAETLSIAGRDLAGGAATAGPRELWRWLVLAGGVLLVLEWFVYVARSRG
ncbi:MAG: VWA domain-containing protein [Planctomycetota bacterium]